MTQSNLQSFVNGFVAALQLPAPDARIAAIRDLAGKGLRLGVAIDQLQSDQKPVDITFAAIDLLGAIVLTARKGDG